MKLKTLDYFCASLIDPFFEVFKILDDTTHKENLALNDDLANIDEGELQSYILEYNVDKYLSRSEDLEKSRRAWFLIDKLQKGIAQKRLQILTASGRTLPYTSNNLKSLPIDQNNLISVRELSKTHLGLSRNDYFYLLSPSLVQSNSSYWTTIALFKIAHARSIDFKIRLDPFIEKHKSEYHPMNYRMWIYGKLLNWARLKELKNEEFGQWVDEYQKRDVGVTDFVWRPEENEIHFTCEELPSISYINYRGSRYFHAIFAKESGNITHCDGAIRIYNESEIKMRQNYHVRHAEVRKIGKRVKIFQVDDELPQDDFSALVNSFFVWNDDVQNYFRQ